MQPHPASRTGGWSISQIWESLANCPSIFPGLKLILLALIHSTMASGKHSIQFLINTWKVKCRYQLPPNSMWFITVFEQSQHRTCALPFLCVHNFSICTYAYCVGNRATGAVPTHSTLCVCDLTLLSV